MATEKFIMVSLEDEKAKKIANVISNDTSRKILEFLSDNEAAENDIAEKLDLPASTVHYNIQHLLEQDLIEVKDFYWSEKGNKVNIYTVAKKLIVIAPKSMKIKTKLKNILPVALLALAASGAIHLYTKLSTKPLAFGGGMEKMVATQEAIAPRMLEVAQKAVETAAPNYALWFLTGSFFAIATYVFITSIRKEKK
ncbi:MAG: helix-turn-helix transcriptional regulator [Nanoarchaeota archaeon]|nr:helix-turn-helix transcriptional regulator [Nanoarchaeota archaeon]